MMAAGGLHLRPRVIVVGDGRNAFVREAAELAGRYELAVTQREDIYSAVTALAQSADRPRLVAGLARALAIEDGRFFALAQRNGVPCCCLVDENAAAAQGQLLAVVRRGARLVWRIEEFRAILDEWLAAQDRHPQEAEDDLLHEAARVTETELKALLGHESDG